MMMMMMRLISWLERVHSLCLPSDLAYLTHGTTVRCGMLACGHRHEHLELSTGCPGRQYLSFSNSAANQVSMAVAAKPSLLWTRRAWSLPYTMSSGVLSFAASIRCLHARTARVVQL